MIIPVLLAGGSGNRLWPLSRELYPKQCINLTDPAKTLIQQTLERVRRCGIDAAPVVVCNNDHRFLIAQQMLELGISGTIMLEPTARNTAAAIALAALKVQQKNPAASLLVLPADHLINDTQRFSDVVNTAYVRAEAGELVTFGVVPNHPETGYGYIEAEHYGKVSPIKAFHEKPKLATATQYVNAGNYYWNSGMFMFTPDAYLSELQHYQPDVYQAVKLAMLERYTDLDFVRVSESAFSKSPSISIDNGIMEHTAKGTVVPYHGDWSDIGSWQTVYDHHAKDEDGNVVVGDVLLEDVQNSLIRSDSRLVTAVGVSDLAIIDTHDALLVMSRKNSQAVKTIVNRLKKHERAEVRQHQKVYRPWGSYETVNLGEHYQVKHVKVNPGAKFALQVHQHRAEHWVILHGVAKVRIGEREQVLHANESIHINVGDVHTLHNPGTTVLDLIEVQTGDCIDEEDVVRFANYYQDDSGGVGES
ncbi:mannose-1-phosphate guanylyltransferase/mannose-6-phosphate isomerase [Gilvimarinus polysaccharolyticus]|uniref:mannose-1-phosphate guanylyltransferase/mannose-6-phosphate isomerase n=1 Tax=Gilvimarinus polysaccharolyticus TaxID=863921 RepID=UPI0006731F62|nr:mannose-1-phosphate guanylyltransferase/mannose-6-phosphate isomerase [Gilvimarinus polysaccharolyticus]